MTLRSIAEEDGAVALVQTLAKRYPQWRDSNLHMHHTVPLFTRVSIRHCLRGTEIIPLTDDDQESDQVGYNEHPQVESPVLDEVATSGLQFDRI